jgi:DNA-binding NtrC family response regulator
VLCDGDEIGARHLSPTLVGGAEVSSGAALGRLWNGEESLADVVGRVERAVIERALKDMRGQKAATARQLALSRPGLDGKIQRYGIDAAAIRTSARQKPGEAD